MLMQPLESGPFSEPPSYPGHPHPRSSPPASTYPTPTPYSSPASRNHHAAYSAKLRRTISSKDGD